MMSGKGGAVRIQKIPCDGERRGHIQKKVGVENV